MSLHVWQIIVAIGYIEVLMLLCYSWHYVERTGWAWVTWSNQNDNTSVCKFFSFWLLVPNQWIVAKKRPSTILGLYMIIWCILKSFLASFPSSSRPVSYKIRKILISRQILEIPNSSRLLKENYKLYLTISLRSLTSFCELICLANIMENGPES